MYSHLEIKLVFYFVLLCIKCITLYQVYTAMQNDTLDTPQNADQRNNRKTSEKRSQNERKRGQKRPKTTAKTKQSREREVARPLQSPRPPKRLEKHRKASEKRPQNERKNSQNRPETIPKNKQNHCKKYSCP